jgi:hypothetical protein
VPFGRVAEWLKLFKLLAYAPWFRAITRVAFLITLLVEDQQQLALLFSICM